MDLQNETHTLGLWLRDRAQTDGARVAVDDRGVTTDYATLSARADALAESFKKAGFVNGDRIVTVTGNSVDHIVLFFACAQVGLVLSPLSWRLTVAELAELLVRADPRLIVYEDDYATLALEAVRVSGTSTPAQMIGLEGIESDLLRVRHIEKAVWRDPQAADPLLLIFTSGSEAKPKGVLLSHSNCYWNNLSLRGASGVGPEDKVLCILPQFHVGGWNIYPLLALWVGGTVVIERTFQPRRVLELVRERGVTVMMGVPTQYQMLAQDAEFEQADLSSLRLTQVGGASASTELFKAWQSKGVVLSPGYGLTEASPNVLHGPAEYQSTAMQPYPYVKVRLGERNDETQLRGELQISGPGVFSGYLEDPEATRAVFTSDGWLKTGDIAEYDPHGGIHIVGRIKDIFISGGENVAPAEVEDALYRHPAVAVAAVVGMPDATWGEVGCAFVELNEIAKETDADELEMRLIGAVRHSLAPFKIPKRVIVLDEIPRIGIDKVDRLKLKEMAHKLSEGVETP